MTREEAIKKINAIKKYLTAGNPIWDVREIDEVLNTAIDALSTDVKTKCIARIEIDTEEIVKRIKEEYDITDGWIPCSERLPSDDESVIVSVLDDRGDTPWKYTTVAWRYNGVWISDNDILCGTAVAWMPLPKPYKGGDRE